MLWVIGTSEPQPCASKVAPHGAAFESTIFFELSRNSSQVAGAALGTPALLVMPECQAEPITSRKNGQLYNLPSTVHSSRIEGMMSSITSFGMKLSQGSMTPALL